MLYFYEGIIKSLLNPNFLNFASGDDSHHDNFDDRTNGAVRL